MYLSYYCLILFIIFLIIYLLSYPKIAQSAGAVGYTDYTSAEG